MPHEECQGFAKVLGEVTHCLFPRHRKGEVIGSIIETSGDFATIW